MRSLLICVLVAACGDDPVYLAPMPGSVEINTESGAGGGMARVIVPIRTETADEMGERMDLATELGLTIDQIPQVRRDKIDLAVEWTVKNLEDEPGNATLSVVGANEFFAYDPAAFVIDPEEDEEPPALLGGKPIEVAPLGVTSGVLREDELSEAAQDIDAITRSGLSPERVLLTQWETADVVDDMGVVLMPSAAIPALIQIDVTFTGNTHMVLEYVVRVRDHMDRLRPDEMDTSLLVAPAAQGSYVPPPPPPMP